MFTVMNPFTGEVLGFVPTSSEGSQMAKRDGGRWIVRDSTYTTIYDIENGKIIYDIAAD